MAQVGQCPRCPADFCLLLGFGATHWIVTADNDYRVLDIAWITAMKYGFNAVRGRQRRLAIMDSVFGWDGDRVKQPSHFADTRGSTTMKKADYTTITIGPMIRSKGAIRKATRLGDL